MKKLVDARMQYSGGIGTYIQQILPHFDFENLSLSSSIYSIKEQWELYKKIPPCDLFWTPHFNAPLLPIQAKKRIVTIHDLYHLEHLDPFKRIYAKILMKGAVQKADLILTISEFTKGKILRFFPGVEEKITVVPLGCNHLRREQPIEGLPENFFLFVGNLKPHKNLSLVLDALSAFPEKHLVIAGQLEGFIHGENLSELKKRYSHMKDRVHFLGKVTDEGLTYLYMNAEALIFSSFYEGLGLPPLEAMNLGCPVLASNAASIPEACGEAALYFDPTKKEELIQAIQGLEKERKNLVIEGKKRAALYTWERSIEAHKEAFSTLPYTSDRRTISSSPT